MVPFLTFPEATATNAIAINSKFNVRIVCKRDFSFCSSLVRKGLLALAQLMDGTSPTSVTGILFESIPWNPIWKY
jgi:hypothetical protein